jgi:hypothetical protein
VLGTDSTAGAMGIWPLGTAARYLTAPVVPLALPQRLGAAGLEKWLIQKTPARASHLTPFFIPETFADCPPCMQATNCIRPHAHLTRRKRGG